MRLRTRRNTDPPAHCFSHCSTLVALSLAVVVVGGGCARGRDSSASTSTTAADARNSSIPSLTPSTVSPLASSPDGGDPDVVVDLAVAPTSSTPGTVITVTTRNATRRCSRSTPVRILFVDNESFARGLTSIGEFIIPPKEMRGDWQSDELRAEYVITADTAKGSARIRLECRGILVGATDFMVL